MTGLPDARTDAELLARLAFHDHGALRELYDRHSRLLYGLLVRMLRNQPDAEQILEETFVHAWTCESCYSPEVGSPVAWLIGIARARAIDRLRADGRETGQSEREGITRRDASSGHERQAQVQQAFDALPTEQRAMIERSYFLGATQTELAAFFDLPLETVKAQVRAGLLALRALDSGN